MFMPRPLCVEFAGAPYHVLNHGNSRQDIFAHQAEGEASERALLGYLGGIDRTPPDWGIFSRSADNPLNKRIFR